MQTQYKYRKILIDGIKSENYFLIPRVLENISFHLTFSLTACYPSSTMQYVTHVLWYKCVQCHINDFLLQSDYSIRISDLSFQRLPLVLRIYLL